VEGNVLSVLRGNRWAISGFGTGSPPYETQFARAFADYNGAAHCVPTANGTSALMCSLQALGVGAGDEVIVPGLTWVACATSVVAINATPVLVDIDKDSLCLNPEAARRAITPRTRAIMVVHLYSGIADLDSLLALSRDTGVPLLEDCAQSHGALWRGHRVGTLGKVGTFSMQQGKVLTAGEGGACITDDAEIADAIYRLRSDGRRPTPTMPQVGRMEMEDAPGVLGQNFCLSEVQSAILLAQLGELDRENETRAENSALLRQRLADVEGLSFQQSAPGTERATIYHLPVRIDRSKFNDAPIARISEALSAELGMWIHQPYAPLSRNALYDPSSSSRTRLGDAYRKSVDPSGYSLPVATQVHENAVVLHHSAFLGTADDAGDIAAAFTKVQRHSSSL
jgi:L-glutamine:scyllo-inosose aminotransferase/L-glutamine:2-deoxy-scyllo-inosose/3-amino-2,3-dideoxy-scyllo-inosose aminotransferase